MLFAVAFPALNASVLRSIPGSGSHAKVSTGNSCASIIRFRTKLPKSAKNCSTVARSHRSGVDQPQIQPTASAKPGRIHPASLTTILIGRADCTGRWATKLIMVTGDEDV